eukprot:SAG11_NODE_25155_length_363_cov_0.590909_1_plen_33_part_10
MSPLGGVDPSTNFSKVWWCLSTELAPPVAAIYI